MIAIAFGLVKLLVLLVPGVICLASPESVRNVALEARRRYGLDRSWQDRIFTEDFLVSIRLFGVVLLFFAALLGFVVFRQG
ncbi:MAG TPA: hypothetical protein VIM86_17245 [Thermodesulfobacteriota bacterium]